MTRYFEIYVPGKNGYSLYVKSDNVPFPQDDLSEGSRELDCISDEQTIIEMAVKAKVLDPNDADIVRYVCEMDLNTVQNERGIASDKLEKI
ncbi:MAG TPA: hypothetical protein PKX15_00350 [Bacteroidales bacterium]|nr:hypothetical protein [Bacteroidales bacterium]